MSLLLSGGQITLSVRLECGIMRRAFILMKNPRYLKGDSRESPALCVRGLRGRSAWEERWALTPGHEKQERVGKIERSRGAWREEWVDGKALRGM